MSKIQVPSVGGIRKVVKVPTAQTPGTIIDGFAGQTLTVAQLKILLGTGTTPGTAAGGSSGAAASLNVGPGLAGGGVLTGAVPLRLIAPIPFLDLDSDGGGGDGELGPPGRDGVAGPTGAPGPIGVPIFMQAENGEDGLDGIPGPPGANGATGAAGPLGAALFFLADDGAEGEMGVPGPAGPVGPAGSGSSLENVTPDTHPSTPNSADDEFEVSSLDAKWVWFNQGGFTYSIDNGAINFIDPNGGAGAAFSSLLQTAPGAAPWKFRIKVSADIFDVNNSYAGLGAYDSVSGTLAMIGPMNPGGGIGNYPVLSFSPTFPNAGGTVLSGGVAVTHYGGQTDWCYYEIECDGTNLFFRQSKSGVEGSFRTIYTNTMAAIGIGLPTHIGMSMNMNYQTKFTVDWFRRIN